MKRKVLALILAILCLSMAVVGCGQACTEHVDENKDAKCDKCEAEIKCEAHTDADQNQLCDVCNAAMTPACEKHVDADQNLECDSCKAKLCAHKDENADNRCDSCGLGLVALNVQVPPVKEDRVDMVVGTIPSDVALDTYVNTAPEKPVTLRGEEIEFESRAGQFVLIKLETLNGLNASYEVKDLVSGKTVYTKANVHQNDSFDIYLYDYYFVVETENLNAASVYEYYSYEGYAFAKDTVLPEGERLIPNGAPFMAYYYKLQLGESVYIFDLTSRALLFKDLEAKHFVNRPTFDYVGEEYGYQLLNGELFIYDLSKWIDCAYSLEIPSYAENPTWRVLDNGNVVLQWRIELVDTATSYDYIESGKKYDLVTTLIDIESMAAKEVEFGYVLRSLYSAEALPIVKDTAPNVAALVPVVNDRMDTQATKFVVLDNDLTILYNFGQTFDLPTSLEEISPVDENLFVILRNFGGTRAYEIVNEAGEHVCYLASSVEAHVGFLGYGGDFYNFKMESILDLDVTGYDVAASMLQCVILSRRNAQTNEIEYFFFDGKKEPVKMELDVMGVQSHALGFVVTHRVTEEGGTKTVYSLYNFDNTLIASSDSNFVNGVNWLDEDRTVGIVENFAGQTYLVK